MLRIALYLALLLCVTFFVTWLYTFVTDLCGRALGDADGAIVRDLVEYVVTCGVLALVSVRIADWLDRDPDT